MPRASLKPQFASVDGPEQTIAGVASVDRLRCPNAHELARGWRRICQDATSLSVILLPRAGSLSLTCQNVGVTINGGQLAIFRDLVPHIGSAQRDENDDFDLLQIALPTRILCSAAGTELGKFAVMRTSSADIEVVGDLYRQIWEGGERLAVESRRTLAEAGVVILGSAMRSSLERVAERRSIIAERYADVCDFVEQNLSNQNLSVPTASHACGISKRYLSFILRSHGTSFGELVWRNRLEVARDWLAASDSDQITVSEVSYACGFKSTAHFSRKFKKVFACSPSDARRRPGSESRGVGASVVRLIATEDSPSIGRQSRPRRLRSAACFQAGDRRSVEAAHERKRP